MTQVLVFDNDVDKALRVFKQRVNRDGVLKELKFKRSFESKGQKRKRKNWISTQRRKKAARRRAGNR
jgi:small subunit ribosomal protein S21